MITLMNDYAISIAWITGSLLVLLLTLHLTVTRLVYRRSSGAWRWITPGLVTIGTTIVWFMLAMLLFFFFAFCSSCFGPGTPQERTFYGIIGLPLFLIFDELGASVILVVLGLYFLGLSYAWLVNHANLGRALLWPSAPALAALLVIVLVITTIMPINNDPNGTKFGVPANAQNVVRGDLSYWHLDKGPALQVTFDTPDPPETVLRYYQNTLQPGGWVLLTKTAETPTYRDTYWRDSAAYNSLRLTVEVKPTASSPAHVQIIVHEFGAEP